jgi:hypothetical protein
MGTFREQRLRSVTATCQTADHDLLFQAACLNTTPEAAMPLLIDE